MKKEYNFWVYILTNWNKKTLYVGFTNNLVARLKEHYENRGDPKTFAGKYCCYYMVYFEWHQYAWNAIAREKELELMKRDLKVALINEFNPQWKFLNIEFCGEWPPKIESRRSSFQDDKGGLEGTDLGRRSSFQDDKGGLEGADLGRRSSFQDDKGGLEGKSMGSINFITTNSKTMKKMMICLANSKKYSGRCIAGIEVEPKPGGGWHMLRRNGKPKWLRPVSPPTKDYVHGQIDEDDVRDIRLLDVVEFEMVRECPEGYQSENVFFRKRSLQKVAEMPRLPALLDKLVEPDFEYLFGTPGKAVSKYDIAGVDHSLVFAKVEQVEVYYPVVYKTFNPKGKILCHGRTYDLSITDLQTIVELQENPKLLESCEHLYCTFSLGMEFHEEFYKIAAGLIYV